MSIVEGSFVDVHFARSDTLFYVRVEHIPHGTGDCWRFIDRDGIQHNSTEFERMDEIDVFSGEKGREP